MSKILLTITAASAILATGALLSSTAQALPVASHSAIKADNAFETVATHYKRGNRHAVRRINSEITSFYSSSGIGVNHPPRK
jgi:hypothetical protein